MATTKRDLESNQFCIAQCVQHGKNLSCTFAKGKKLFLATTISSALSQKRQNTITACKLFEAYQKKCTRHSSSIYGNGFEHLRKDFQLKFSKEKIQKNSSDSYIRVFVFARISMNVHHMFCPFFAPFSRTLSLSSFEQLLMFDICTSSQTGIREKSIKKLCLNFFHKLHNNF